MNNTKTIILISALALITVIAIIIMIWAIWFREPDIIINPDYAPEEEEPNQESMEGSGDKLEQPDGGGAVSILYSTDDIIIDLSEKKISLMFGNPSRSNMDMILQVVIQDQVIVQSGRITPGHRVRTLELIKDAEKMLSTGGYKAKYVVLYYDPESGEKAIVNTEIPIDITVKE